LDTKLRESVPGSEDEIRIGWSSWDDGADISIKYAHCTGPKKAVGGYGEVPLAALPQMLQFAIREGVLSHDGTVHEDALGS
jgi:hypothetical protein